MTLPDFISRLEKVRRSGEGYTALCPAHDDKNASLSVAAGDDGRILVKCHAGCSTEEIVESLGLTMKDLFPPKERTPKERKTRSRTVATYHYPNGAMKVRKEPKTFSWRYKDANGMTVYRKPKGRLLYTAGVISEGCTVLVPEGEKDCDNLHRLGYIAACGPDGAGPGKWKKHADQTLLSGCHVVVIPDHDEVGMKYAEEVCASLQGAAASVRLADLQLIWPDIQEHGDVSDMLTALGDLETCRRLNDLVANTEEWKQPDQQVTDRMDEIGEAIRDMVETCRIRQFGKALYRLSNGKRYRLLTQKFIDNQLIRVRGIPAEKATAASRTVQAYLDEDAEDIPVPKYYAGFRNGVLNWRTLEFGPYTEDTVCFTYFDVNYDPAADTTFVESVLKDWCQGNLDRYQMLLELVGACLYRDKPIKKWWVITGVADTGKSTFLELIRNVIGNGMIGSVPIQDIKDPNAIAELLDKTVNIVDDGSSHYVYDLSRLRQIIQGTDMQLKILYQDKFTAKLEARMLFVFNETPRFRDDNGATAKKMMAIRFDRVYSNEEKDVHLLDKLTTEANRSALVKLAVNAMKGVLDRNLTFTVSEESRQIVSDLITESDQFKSYIKAIEDDEGYFDWYRAFNRQTTASLYSSFSYWAELEGYERVIKRKTFTERLKKLPWVKGLTKSDGSYKVLIDEDLKSPDYRKVFDTKYKDYVIE